MPDKVRYSDYFGLDVDQIIDWKRVHTEDMTAWDLVLYLPGNTITLKEIEVGEEGLKYLLQYLTEKFSSELPLSDSFGKAWS